MCPAFNFSNENLRLVKNKPEENGQDLKVCFCGRERGMLTRIITKALREPRQGQRPWVGSGTRQQGRGIFFSERRRSVILGPTGD